MSLAPLPFFLLQGDTNYPATSADLSLPTSTELRIPLTHTEKVEYRERYLRTLYKAEALKRVATVYTAEIQDVDKEMDRYSYAMFEVALEKDQTARAFDSAACFNFRSTYEQAMKKAHSKGHAALVKGMTEVLSRRFSKCRRLCQLPDPGQKEKKKELQERRFKEKIQKIVPVPGPPLQTNSAPDDTQLDDDGGEPSPESENGTTSPDQETDRPAASGDIAKRLFVLAPDAAASESPKPDVSKKTSHMASPAKTSQIQANPFSSFSPSSHLKSTPSTMGDAMSTLAAMSQCKPESMRVPTTPSPPQATTKPMPFKPSTTFRPTSNNPKPASKPGTTYRVVPSPTASVSPAATAPAPPSTPSPTAPTSKMSAENKLEAVKFVRNPSHTYTRASGTPAPNASPAGPTESAPPPMRFDEPAIAKKPVAAVVSTGLASFTPEP